MSVQNVIVDSVLSVAEYDFVVDVRHYKSPMISAVSVSSVRVLRPITSCSFDPIDFLLRIYEFISTVNRNESENTRFVNLFARERSLILLTILARKKYIFFFLVSCFEFSCSENDAIEDFCVRKIIIFRSISTFRCFFGRVDEVEERKRSQFENLFTFPYFIVQQNRKPQTFSN